MMRSGLGSKDKGGRGRLMGGLPSIDESSDETERKYAESQSDQFERASN